MKKINKEKSVVYSQWSDSVTISTKGTLVNDFDKPESYYEGVLWGIRAIAETPFMDRYGNWYKYFVPESTRVLEEEPKKLRPFKNIEEFFKKTENEIGKVIRYKEKKNAQQVVTMINGYTNDGLVILGGIFHSLTNLFENFEYYDNDNTQWKPFGVEDES